MDGISLISLIEVLWVGIYIAFALGLVFGLFRRALYWILSKGRKAQRN
jgi:hypothetical protein